MKKLLFLFLLPFCLQAQEMDLPLFEDFDSYAIGSWPPGWHRLRTYGSFPAVSSQSHYSGNRSMMLEAENDTLLFCSPSPVPTDGNNIYVRYYAYMYMNPYASHFGTKWIKAGVMTDTSDFSTFVVLDSVDAHEMGEAFEEREFHTRSLDSSASYWVAWMFFSTENYFHGWGDNDGFVDDIYIDEIPTCMHVISVDATEVSTESITLSWTNHELNTYHNYAVNYWSDGGDTLSVYTTDTFYTFTFLTPNTLYTFSVTADCGDERTFTISVRTACEPISIPYVEGFENQADGVPPSCWSILNGEVKALANQAHSGTKRLDFHCPVNTVTGNITGSAIAILPLLEEEANTLQLSLWTRPASSYAGCGSLSVGYMTDPADENTFNALETYSYRDYAAPDGAEYTEYRKKTVLFVDVPEGARMALRHNEGYSHWHVDDIRVDSLPPCLPVKHPAVSDVTDSSATVHWAPREGQSAWYVKIGNTVYTTNDTSYTLTGLLPNILYTVHVATCCGSDTSVWRSVSFKTDCTMGSGDVTIQMESPSRTGWFGDAKLYFFQYGQKIDSVTLANNSDGFATVKACCGSPVTFSWYGGRYNISDYDCSYTVFDGNMGEVYNSANGGLVLGGTIADPCNDCQVPSNVRVTAVDSTTITVSWDTVGSAFGYLISIDSGAYTSCNNGSYTFTGLAPDSEHTFRVLTRCGRRKVSNTVTLVKSTTCGALIPSIKENFENYPFHSLPKCWYVVCGTSRIESWTEWHSEHSSLQLLPGTLIVTPLVPLPGDFIGVSLWASHYYDTLDAGIMTNPADTGSFISLASDTNANGEMQFLQFNTLSLSHDSSYYVAFRYNSNHGSAYIDDIEIFEDTSVAHYDVHVFADNPFMGTVTGGGRYVENYSLILTATPKPGYRFVCWQDSVPDSVRTVTVTGDTSFTAHFATESIGIDDVHRSSFNIQLCPNPTSSDVTVSVGSGQQAVVSVIDLQGRTVIPATTIISSYTIPHSSLPSGTYLLRITTSAGITTKKLQVQ